MDLNLYITKGFPIEWPDEAMSNFKIWLKKHGYTKDTVLHVKSEPKVVGESLALTLKSIMPTLHVFINEELTKTHPTFICYTDLEVTSISGFQFPTIYTYRWFNNLPEGKVEIQELTLEGLSGPERHARLTEAKQWADAQYRDQKSAVILSDLCFSGTLPKEVRTCLL